jgi:TolB-like protein/DNA-binding winged helix-turn-helix (wHTH) protein/Tfp pilus assembly protein PilF
MLASTTRGTLRFRDFELDVEGYQLRRQGRPIRLERRPMELLILLVEQRGRLVSRSEIAERLWGKAVFVDVDTGVNIAIRKIRQALRDSAEQPAFVETVIGKGYRFVAPVEGLSVAAEAAAARTIDNLPASTKQQATSNLDLHWSGGRGVPVRRLRILGLSGCAVLAALAVWLWFGVHSTPVKLAVLPFANLTGNPELEYVSEGLTEEATVTLAQIAPQHVSVVGRQSAMQYKNSAKSLAAIGNELDVNYLVEGSIRAEGQRLRITSKLIRVRDQVQLWSQSYDREAASLLGVQRDLSTAIAEQIRLRLSPERIAAVARRQSDRPEAFDLYLRGRYFANQRTSATVARALEFYRQATTIDPNYALAWSGISDALTSRPINSDFPPLEVRAAAREAAERALRADSQLAEAQTALGRVYFWLDWKWPAAEVAFRRAIDLNERYGRAHVMLGHLLSQTGRHAEAIASLRRARELDPLDAMTHAMSAQVAYQAGDYASALEHGRQATVIDSEFWIGHAQQALAYQQLGQHNAALEAIMRAGRLSGGTHNALAAKGHLLATLGRTLEAREVLRTLEEAARERYVPPAIVALVYAGLDDRARAFEWLEKAYVKHDAHLAFLQVDPRWAAYRDDPRFRDLVARCGFMREATQ